MLAPTKQPKRQRATPDSIIAAARNIARERGWSSVTIRAIAVDLGYTSPLIYEHFKNKEDAIAEAARRGFVELAEVLRDVEGASGTEVRLRAMAEAYVQFARRCPELYQVMHGLDGAVTDPAIIAEGAKDVCELVARELGAWAETMPTRMPNPLAATELLWCLVHGIATLTLTGRIVGPNASNAVQTLLDGWKVHA